MTVSAVVWLPITVHRKVRMLNKVLNLVVILLFAAGLCASSIVGGCEMLIPTQTGSVPMKCIGGFNSVSLLLGVGLILAIVRLFLKNTEARRFAALSLGLIVLAAALIPSPLVVGVCSWEGAALCCSPLAEAGASAEELAWCSLTMDCHISAAVVWVMATLILVCLVIQVLTTPSDTSEKTKPRLFD